MMLLVLTLTVLVGSMAGGLALSSQAERQIAAAHRRSVQLGYTSESVTERCVTALESETDWREAPGAFVCGVVVSSPEVDARTTSLNRSLTNRFPFGPDTPRWRLVSASEDGPYRSAIWIADDPADRDLTSAQDSNGRVMLHAETRAVGDAVRVIEVHLERVGGATRRLSWREVW